MGIELLFVGLGEIGASMALALAESGVEAQIIGYDPEKRAARALQETGALHRMVLNPYKAARSADFIVITLPRAEAGEYLEDIADELKPGTVVLDCSALSSSRLRWAQDHLAQDRHYLAAFPILRPDLLHDLERGYGAAQPSLFQDSSLALVIPPEAPEVVVNSAVNFADTIGSVPFFLDASEMDAVTSLIDTVPSLLGIALLRLAHNSPSWPDVQRLAGRPFAAATHPPGRFRAKALAQTWIDNRESLALHLDYLIRDLQRLKSWVEQDEEEALAAELDESLKAYSRWLSRRSRSDWRGEAMAPAEANRTGLIGDLLGFDPLRRRKKD